jgi:hypothetical protein
MTTTEAFEHLTSKRGWYKLCKINEASARNLKRNFKLNKLSLDKIHSLLETAGYSSKIKWVQPKSVKLK